jgi:hypothetical protein
MKEAPEVLDTITDVVLKYRPKPKSKGSKKRKRKEKKIARDGSQQHGS